MSQLDDAMTALKNADAAGDHEAAQRLAGIADQLRQQQASQPSAPSASDKAKSAIVNLTEGNPLNRLGPNDKPITPPSLASAAKSVASSTAFGGIAGALSPEIVTGIGIAASFIPGIGEAIGPPIIEAGSALEGMRGAEAVTGAFSGALSETAGQTVEHFGGSKTKADVARLAGGMLTPGAGGGVEMFVSTPLKAAWRMTKKFAGVDVDVKKAVVKAGEKLAAMKEAGQPETAMHAMLQTGVEANRQASVKAADKLIADATREEQRLAAAGGPTSTRLVDEARARGDKMIADAARDGEVLDKAADGKLATAKRVLAQEAPKLAKVGQVRELTDIGTQLREAAVAKQGAEIEARNTAYKATETERDAVVKAKEAAGQTIGNSPSLVDLKKELKGKLEGEGGFAKTTDAGVRRVYQQVHDALNPPGQKISFEALDQIRRRLGDVGKGREVEGYEAIGKKAADKMYAQISKAQEEFVGANAEGVNIQRKLQSEYAEDTGDLARFGSKEGKKLTALDKLGGSATFRDDPKNLPKAFFNSQQSIRAAKELTGNPQLVERQAADYAARSLQGHESKAAEKWLNDNGEWVKEVPGLEQRVKGYIKDRAQIERLDAKLRSQAKAKATEAEQTRQQGIKAGVEEKQAGVKEATKAAEGLSDTRKRVMEEGQKAAEAKQKEVFEPSKKLEDILKGGEKPEAIHDLLLHGKPEQTRLAANMLSTQPGGKTVLEQSVRQTLKGLSKDNLQKQWVNRIRPMLSDGKMIPPERLKALEKDVTRLINSHDPKKLSLVQRHIVAALGTAGGAAGAAAERAAFD